jgi:serine/threonine-protein kinase
MSHVYKAKRVHSNIQKYVAIKVISKESKQYDDSLKKLFISEQIALSKLTHPNIISFHHGGISKKGKPYLVMEYVKNTLSIRDYCTKNKLSTKQIVIKLIPIIEALAYAHQQLIVHKDIKPSNIIIDGNGTPFIVDFGISALLSDAKSYAKNSKQIYTPDYASPEQVLNKEIGITSDVFSFTAVLLELLSHTKPLSNFDGEHYSYKHCKKHIESVIASVRLDSDLSNIIRKGLQEEPIDRFQSMQELKSDLKNYLSHKPISATKHNTYYLMKKFLTRNPLSSFVVGILFFGIVYSNISLYKQKNQAEFEAIKAKQVTEFLIESIQSSDPDLTKGQDVTVKEFLNNATINAQISEIQDPLLAASLKQVIGTALAKVGQYEEAELLLHQAIETDPKNFKARIKLIQLYLDQSRVDLAEKEYAYVPHEIYPLSELENIHYLQIKAQIQENKGEFKLAIETIKQATSQAQKVSNTSEFIQSQRILAKILNTTGESQKAVNILEGALALSNEAFGEISTSSTELSWLLADIFSNMNPIPFDKINPIYDATIKTQIKLYGKHHPKVAKTYLQHGFTLKAERKFSEAEKQAKLAKKIAIENFGEKHILTAHINLLLSQISYFKNDIKSAISQLNKVIQMYEETYGKDHFETNQVKTTLALYLIKDQQGTKALALLLPMYESQIKQVGENHQSTLYIALNILHAYNLEKQYTKTIEQGEKLLKRAGDQLGAEGVLTIGIQAALAEGYLFDNQAPKAIGLLEPLLRIAFIKNNPPYFKKFSLILVKSYFKNKQFEKSNQLINIIVNKYSNEASKDIYFQKLLSYKK